MIPSRSRWDPYLSIATTMARRHGVPVALVLAVMSAESNFDPAAYRAEPQIGDASRGLMQVLLMTARGLGFAGPPDQLFDPAINADLGTKLLGINLRARGGDVAKAVSQYNGGYRPALGFGEPRPDGLFQNEAYVRKVLGAADAFALALGVPMSGVTGGGSTSAPAPAPATPEPGAGVGWGVVALVVGAIVAAVALLAKR